MAIPMSISQFLSSNHIPYEVLQHPRAHTALEEAAVTHVPDRMWAKTVACYADGDPILAVLPADCRIDINRLRTVTGARALRFAAENELVPLYPDCEAGAMPPLGTNWIVAGAVRKWLPKPDSSSMEASARKQTKPRARNGYHSIRL